MITTLAATTYESYLPLIILVIIAVGFGVVNVAGSHFLTYLLGSKHSGKIKDSVYESGMNPIGTARKRFNIRFYLVAVTFLVFDVEIVFLYPWATAFSNLKGGTEEAMQLQFLARMFFFIATSIIAYLYAVRKGVFKFD